mmetsp:Transcript_11784/g.11669  ORF Transcript_11784/g.11669 Transcript_11784/m.11669 type:complete len:132 (+) Transcript_11784:40-435(+)
MPDFVSPPSISEHHIVDLLLANSGLRFLIAAFLGPTESTKGLFATCWQLCDINPITSRAPAETFTRNALILWPAKKDESPDCDVCGLAAAPDGVATLDILFIICLHDPQFLGCFFMASDSNSITSGSAPLR